MIGKAGEEEVHKTSGIRMVRGMSMEDVRI